jgi:HD-GYP domain-containing protein (c-di-GMP phosphodiesterase class II)
MEKSNSQELSVESIRGGEILAKDINLNNGTLFMSEGAVLKSNSGPRLKSLGIRNVYIVPPDEKELIEQTTESIISGQCKDIVKTTIDKFSYGIDSDLEEIAKIAEQIMLEVLSQPEVLYNVSRIRDKSERFYLHCINVAALSVLVGIKSKMQEDRLKGLAIGALLHDIGLIFIPFNLSKIEIGHVDDATDKELKRHVIYGYSVVERETWIPVNAKEVIIGHHERVDGTGYPFRLTADRISLETKIVSICDVFDSIVYGIFYKKRKVNEAMDYIVSQAGLAFDVKAVRSFVDSVAAYPIGTTVSTNNGDTGIVIRQNNGVPTRPVLKIRTISENSKFKPGDELDLTKDLTTMILDSIG